MIKTKELADLLSKRKTVKLFLEKSDYQPHKTKVHWRLKIKWDKNTAIYTSFRDKERTWTDLNNAVKRIKAELHPMENQILQMKI